jgi:hypothetical protein
MEYNQWNNNRSRPYESQQDFRTYPSQSLRPDQSNVEDQSQAFQGGTNYSFQQASTYPSPQHQQPVYSAYPHVTPYSNLPPGSRQGHNIKSPRQQFSDSLRRGVQTFDFHPTGGNNRGLETQSGGNRSGNPFKASIAPTLPARPDLAIWAAENGNASQPQNSSQGNASRSVAGASSRYQSYQPIEPPRAAPTVPLSSRFPPLPPKASVGKKDDTEELQKQIAALEAREEALLLRIEALGFEPEAAWQVMKEVDQVEGDSSHDDARKDRETPAPILGIRLLQRLDLLQKENAELEEVFAQKENGGSELRGE